MSDIFPVGPLMRELVLALGAALVLSQIAVLVRESRRTKGDPRPRPDMRIVALNLAVGAVLTLWGLSSILLSRG